VNLEMLSPQRHAFRAKPTRDIARGGGGGNMESFGAAGPSMFGPGAVAAGTDDDANALTWTSGMAGRNRHASQLSVLC